MDAACASGDPEQEFGQADHLKHLGEVLAPSKAMRTERKLGIRRLRSWRPNCFTIRWPHSNVLPSPPAARSAGNILTSAHRHLRERKEEAV